MMCSEANKRTSLLGGMALTLLMSFYFFPIGFAGLPETLNTKQMLAVAGVLMYVFKCIRNRSAEMEGYVVKSFLLACVFSLWCFFSCVYNCTSDYAYAAYFSSFAVWLGGAYAVCGLIRAVEGKVDLALVTRYLTLCCVFQCAAVLLVDNLPWFRNLVDTWIIQDKTPIRVHRLYGIGCSLDSGGVRFALCLVLVAHQLATNRMVADSKSATALYIVAFFIITVIGNMVARTTTVGVLLGLLYILVSVWIARRGQLTPRQRRFRRIFLALLLVAAGVTAYLYSTDPYMRRQIRFAFEAFFAYVETGEFSTGSSDVLMERMWIWPWDTGGWISGYGLFEWSGWAGYGIQTDIGYCRFTLYCGLVGMALFALYFIYNASVVVSKFKDAKLLGLVLLSMTFIIWIKVSTDIFTLYAILFCLPAGSGGDESVGKTDEEG